MTAATPHRVAYDAAILTIRAAQRAADAAARTDAATAYPDDTLPEYDDARAPHYTTAIDAARISAHDARAAARRIYLDARSAARRAKTRPDTPRDVYDAAYAALTEAINTARAAVYEAVVVYDAARAAYTAGTEPPARRTVTMSDETGDEIAAKEALLDVIADEENALADEIMAEEMAVEIAAEEAGEIAAEEAAETANDDLEDLRHEEDGEAMYGRD